MGAVDCRTYREYPGECAGTAFCLAVAGICIGLSVFGVFCVLELFLKQALFASFVETVCAQVHGCPHL